ncbi:Uncharacterized protein OBRU01_13350 [Operophtera brumata]|uniref:Uncharacterized protein n=1 Tax=Operophtera brumata TaxID=104452 RepID=A0A0L7L8P6_OPEBR|nr:Uncharacterized protein OBRU01_13350 [Operophtera brumata]
MLRTIPVHQRLEEPPPPLLRYQERDGVTTHYINAYLLRQMLRTIPVHQRLEEPPPPLLRY